MNDHPTTFWIMNSASAAAIVSTIMGWVPAITAIIALVYYCIQIYESQTVQKYVASRRLQRIARLKAKLMMLESKPAPMPPDMEAKL